MVLNFTGKQKMLIEVCVRIMLYELLLKDQQHIHNFTAHLHNLNTGGFGEKEYFFEDTTDWVSCLQDMRDIIAIIDPVFHQKQLDSGAIGLILSEEQLRSRTLNVNVQNTSIHIQMEQRTEEQ